MDVVDLRTRMVGHNRLELLLFRLSPKQLFGINVFKVREVLKCPPLNQMPNAHPFIRGVANIRGVTLPILDLSQATGNEPLDQLHRRFLIISEYNVSTQGFLVYSVERIINTKWEHIHAPPAGAGASNYLTAVTHLDDQLVAILDVEKVLAEVRPPQEQVTPGLLSESDIAAVRGLRVLVADDSSVARKQMQRCVEPLGIELVFFTNGAEALRHLRDLADAGIDVTRHYSLMVSDIEMPEMDGYTLTAEIRRDPNLRALRILLHTSLSGVFNRLMVEKVGADDFLPKFSTDHLANRIVDHLKLAKA